MYLLKKKAIYLACSAVMCGSILFSNGLKTDAASNSLDSNSVENIKGASYYVDGVQFDVPKEELLNFVSDNTITNLPYEPIYIDDTISSEIQPYANACVAGYEWNAKKTSGGFQLAKSGDRVINQTTKPLTQTSSVGSESSVHGSINGSGEFKLGIVESTAGFEVGGSHTWINSQSTTITVDPGYYGWIDYGSLVETWAGPYYYLNGNCSKTGQFNITAKGPKHKATLAKTAKY